MGKRSVSDDEDTYQTSSPNRKNSTGEKVDEPWYGPWPGCFTWLEPDGSKDVSKDLCQTKSGEIVKVKLGIVLPKAAPSNSWEFNLCQNGKCVLGRSLGTFGELPDPIPPLGKKGYFLRETDVTDVMVEHDFDPDESLTGEMTNKTKSFANKYWDLPEPVVIIVPHPDNGGKGKVLIHPNEDRSRYADLLDDFLGKNSEENSEEYSEEDSEEYSKGNSIIKGGKKKHYFSE